MKNDKNEKVRLTILQILHSSNAALSSKTISAHLCKMGFSLSERTVRVHLLRLDNEGLTEYIGRHGRRITKQGLNELSKARVFEKVGFLAAKIDRMSYSMDFDLAAKEGAVVVNISLIKKRQLKTACSLMQSIYNAGYAMGELLTLVKEGRQIGDLIIPKGYAGIGTVCSISVNGVLLKHGIPVISRFGGLLEIQNGVLSRFVQIISYDGTTLDPLEIFIRGKMTDCMGAIKNGCGIIGASFREIPDCSRKLVTEIETELKRIGLGGFLEIGWPGQSLFEIPINEGRIGAVVAGGLNPIALLIESNINIEAHALSGVIDFKQLFPYGELDNKARQLLA
jgi:repressor of nif and glnA expression